MSLCRFGSDGSDVYVYYHVDGFIDCCGCGISDKSFHADTEQQMIDHLREHRARGHHVPEHVFEELSDITTAK